MITSKQILSGAYDRLIATRIKQQHLNITIEEYRWKWAAAIDPYYWTKRVLNYTKLQLYPHVEMCRSMREDCKKYKRILRIQPRGIFKTTIYVISQCLDILRCQPDASIMIGMNNATNARMKLSEIKTHIERNQRFRQLYGDWIENAPRWQADSIIINRVNNGRAEGSVDAVGIDSGVTSRHYTHIIFDDIVDREDRFSAAKRRESLEFFRESFNLVRDKENTPFQMSGTFWHFDDLLCYIIEELNPDLIAKGLEPFYVIKTPVYYESYEPHAGELRYPQIFTKAVLDNLLATEGVVMFTTQYLLKPIPDKTQIFNRSACQYFEPRSVRHDDCRVLGYHDPALGESEKACYAPIITAYIPSYDDPMANILKGDVLIMEMKVDRYTTTQAKAQIIASFREHQHEVIGVERNGFQKVYADDLIRVETKPGQFLYIPIEPIVNTQSKASRIEAFERFYTSGAVKFRNDWQTAPYNYREGLSQLWNYPMDDYCDVPDALAGLMDIINLGTVMIA